MSQFLTSQLGLLHDQLDELACDLSVRFTPAVTDATVATLVAWAKRWDGVILTGIVPARVAPSRNGFGAVPVVQLGEPCDMKCPTGISNVTVDVRNTVSSGH